MGTRAIVAGAVTGLAIVALARRPALAPVIQKLRDEHYPKATREWLQEQERLQREAGHFVLGWIGEEEPQFPPGTKN